MDAIKYLESQHREVETLFKQIEELGDGAGREKKSIFNELARKIEHHAKIEEKVFYPEGEEVDEDMTLEAYEEHNVVRALVSKIKKTSPSDDTYMAKITVLKEMIEHHVEEEEEEYFPKCRRAFGEPRLAELGAELEETFERLEGKSTRKSAPKKFKKAA